MPGTLDDDEWPVKFARNSRRPLSVMGLSTLVMGRICWHRADVDVDRNGLRILDPNECLELLQRTRIGRIALSRSALPTILPVLFSIDDGAVTFHASGGLLESAALRGDIVCFEADLAEEGEGELWSVVVVGKLEIQDRSLVMAGRSPTEHFGGTRVVLTMTIVTGRASKIVVGDVQPSGV